jgi:catechol 2,3-dioxygenase
VSATADRSEAATPGTYGEAPRGYRAPADTRLGRVKLLVSDLGQSLEYYETVLGFRAVARDAKSALLTPMEDDTVLVELHTQPGVRPVARRGRLGLYHFAILLPSRASLGRFARHAQELGVRVGSADHLVSEALYLTDPDNLGIEVYADRPRETWRRVGRELMMAADPIDIAGLLRAGGDAARSGLPAGTTIGHVHLHVGDLPTASSFYSEALGFDRTAWHYPGALFFSAGGYHHHLGTNLWAGSGAHPPHEEEAKLLEWTLELPDADAVRSLTAGLAAAGHPFESVPGRGHDIVTRDPWDTQLRINARER